MEILEKSTYDNHFAAKKISNSLLTAKKTGSSLDGITDIVIKKEEKMALHFREKKNLN